MNEINFNSKKIFSIPKRYKSDGQVDIHGHSWHLYNLDMAFLTGIEASHGCCHLKIGRYELLGLHFFINKVKIYTLLNY